MKYHQEINRIRNKMASNPWPKYLSSIQLNGLRGWTGETIRFNFPVTVIAGENGTGKSTILKAAACAYSSPQGKNDTFYPSAFFPDTPWENITNAELIYKIREGSNEHDFKFRKRLARWRPSGKKRNRKVIIQDVSRTLPLDATVGYAKIAKQSASEVSANTLSEDITKYYSSIIGRVYSEAKFAISNVDNNREVGVVSLAGSDISQFHQGAGEDATLDLLSLLQEIPDTSLVIIDEVEASLHPRSQRRLVHFLLWLARTKQIQIIVTTHSSYVLEEFPPEARILLERKSCGIEILYNISPNFALNRMDDISCPELYIFTEDQESKVLAKTILQHTGIDNTRIEYLDIGPSNIVNAIASVTNNERFPVTAVAIVDADVEAQNGSIKLPGEFAPEKQLIMDIKASAVNLLANRLGKSESSVINALDDTISIQEHHDWPSNIARLLGESTSYIWQTLCSVWVNHCASNDDLNLIKEFVSNKLQ